MKVRILAEIYRAGIGIASASKWVGFIDETRYAIYDSRVSLALRPLTIDEAGTRRLQENQQSAKNILMRIIEQM